MQRGYIRKPEVLALQRAAANLQRRGGADHRRYRRFPRADRPFGRTDRRRPQAAIKTASEQLQEISAELNDVRERIHSIEGHPRPGSSIVAPVKGTVVKLRYHTAGGVIEPGKSIMEIVSLQEELVIEARVRPQDIDKIKHSQIAIVRLTALNQRTTPMVDGQGDLYLGRRAAG